MMKQDSEIDQIRELLQTYYRCFAKFDGEGMNALWHPEGKLFNVGNRNEFLIRDPATFTERWSVIKEKLDYELTIEIDDMRHIVVYDGLIASAEVKWRMVMPDSWGEHCSYYHLAKIDGVWQIAGVVDRGWEHTE